MFVYTIYIVNFWSWAKQSNPNFPFVCKKYFGLDNFELILTLNDLVNGVVALVDFADTQILLRH